MAELSAGAATESPCDADQFRSDTDQIGWNDTGWQLASPRSGRLRRQCRGVVGGLLLADPLACRGDSYHPREQPRCRINALWPKRDGSLIELLRRTCTSNCHGRPTIKLTLL
jgi:hypothetical protein